MNPSHTQEQERLLGVRLSFGIVVPIFRSFRIHQWTKNLLILFPLGLAHKVDDGHIWAQAIVAFFSFSLCASATYVLNDLVDLSADRRHPKKKNRPFASGALSPSVGIALIPVLLFTGLLGGIWVGEQFLLVLFGYFCLTLAYTYRLKRVALADVVLLACLYCIRLFAGSAATGIEVSAWFIAFSMFFFLSLALVKRISEVALSSKAQLETRPAYLGSDLNPLVAFACASAYLAVLVLALYINSAQVLRYYLYPQLLWFLCPLFLYWSSRMILQACRGVLDSDPITYLLKDKVSYLVFVLTAAIWCGAWGIL